jgi:hypothetical protein
VRRLGRSLTPGADGVDLVRVDPELVELLTHLRDADAAAREQAGVVSLFFFLSSLSTPSSFPIFSLFPIHPLILFLVSFFSLSF